MGKSLDSTGAQKRWAQVSNLHERALKALRAIEVYGQADHAAFPERVAARADALAAQQPRDARVSRVEIEEAVRKPVHDELVGRVRSGVRELRREYTGSIAALREIAAQQKRAVRLPRRPKATYLPEEDFPSIRENREVRIQLELLNARLELSNHGIDDLLEVISRGNWPPWSGRRWRWTLMG